MCKDIRLQEINIMMCVYVYNTNIFVEVNIIAG